MNLSGLHGLPAPIPEDARTLINDIFRNCNRSVTETLSRLPTIHEDALDQHFISYIGSVPPMTTPNSGWIISFETHFLGGGHHLGRWEIADIGVLVVVRQGVNVMSSKVALFQSKRLFPNQSKFDPQADEEMLRWGFGRLHAKYNTLRDGRLYKFTEASRYRSLDLRGKQAERVELYQEEVVIPIHYLLYNPLVIPWSRSIPITYPESTLPNNSVGCRVVRVGQMHSLRNQMQTPTFKAVRALLPPHNVASFDAGWSLEDFIVQLLLECHEGKAFGASLDDTMELVFYRRSYPISAAFAVNIEIPG